MNVATQLSRLQTRCGEPSDPAQARFQPSQLLDLLNAARRQACEDTHCYQVKDSQPSQQGVKLYSLPNDFIDLEALEYDGYRLHPVRAQDWRDVVGRDDDALQGTPGVFMVFARQLQLFPVPGYTGKVLQYRGYGYAADLVLNGQDSSFVDGDADGMIWLAAALVKGSDERPNDFEMRQWARAEAVLKKKYFPKGPRYVRAGDLPVPRMYGV